MTAASARYAAPRGFGRTAFTAVVMPMLLMANVSASGASDVSGGTYEVNACVIGAGGARMQGSTGWILDGSIGQPAIAVQSGTGGLRLAVGFWQAASPTGIPSDRIFSNGFDPAPSDAGMQPH